tara:strand:+ start:165 stop:971 length:807 start_codon:yes stop_codon:yes gene_type:complete
MRPSQLPSIREFMLRDYRTDVERLNSLLHNSGDAGLAREVPPIPFTGDIDSVEKGNCICLIGINPLWSAKQVKHEQEYYPAADMINRFRDGEDTAYDEYIQSRLRYFEFEYANWGHFDKSGFGYPGLCFPNEDMRTVWKKNAFAMDIIPYFSRNAGRLNKMKIIENISDPAIDNHQRIVKDIIIHMQPKIIHLNGSHGMFLFEKLFNPQLHLQDDYKRYKLKFGRVVIDGFETSVITHNQFAPGRFTPNPYYKYWPKFIELWNRWEYN